MSERSGVLRRFVGRRRAADRTADLIGAAAETDVVLLAINRPVFMNLVKTNPDFGVSLLTAMAERVRNLAAGVN